MTHAPTLARLNRRRRSGERGSLLITAMLLAAIIGISLVSYLSLGRTTLKLSHRTFFANDATNLAEAGLEEAVYAFNLMSNGTAPATAWTGWTISGTNAMRTLAPFNRDQNAIGTVKVYVKGYDNSDATPYVISQATITPFDGGAPIVRVLQLKLQKGNAAAANGLVALNGLTFTGASFADSFNSNPSNSPTGPWLSYSSGIAHSLTAAAVMAGSVSIASGKVFGDLRLGSGVTAPSTSDYTGTLTTNYSASFPLPTFPTAGSVSQSYNVGSTIPGTLPRFGDLPASDGRYYYFCNNTTIGAVTISASRNVTIVGTNTAMGSGLTLPSSATCVIYMDGALTLSSGNDIVNNAWAGALRIFTSTNSNSTIGNKSQFIGCFHGPNSALTITGGNSAGLVVGSFIARTITAASGMDFHYDEALGPTTLTAAWRVSSWQEFQSSADRASVGTLTSGFLP